MSFSLKPFRACLLGLPLLAASPLALSAEVVQLNNDSLQTISQLSLQQKQLGLNATAGDSLAVISEYTDVKGNQFTRYQQKYNNIPVFAEQIIVNQFATGSNKSLSSPAATVSGTLVNGIASDVAGIDPAQYDPEAMLAKIKQQYIDASGVSIDELVIENEKAKLVYYLDEKKQTQLAYLIEFFTDNKNVTGPARLFYLIDAVSEQVVKSWDGLTFDKVATGPGGNEKVGRYEYDGVMFDNLDVKVAGKKCTLSNDKVETRRSPKWFPVMRGWAAYSFDCFHQENDSVNGAYSPMNDAHYFGGVVFDMYEDWYNTAPLSFKLVLNTHYSIRFDNAFWDGSSMTFGNGASKFYPLVSLDVMAHEVSHGFTEQHSNLVYSDQSGGINEAFSDMAGKAAEFYMHGKNDWMIGSSITKDPKMEALRYMDQPEKDGKSIGHVKDFKKGINVHFSSGVFNKLFYHMATQAGWDTHKAFNVMMAANGGKWLANSDYLHAALGVWQATQELGYETADVDVALKEVGLSCDSSACRII